MHPLLLSIFSLHTCLLLGLSRERSGAGTDAVTVILDKGELEDRLVSVDSRWVLC